jgi:hypothetical protein
VSYAKRFPIFGAQYFEFSLQYFEFGAQDFPSHHNAPLSEVRGGNSDRENGNVAEHHLH